MRSTKKTNSHHPLLGLSIDQRNFIAGLWHGAFLALGMSLTQPTTVISAFVADLTGSTIWVGALSTVLTVAGALPQLFIARWIEPKPRKKPYLLIAIFLRIVSWGTLSWLIVTIGDKHHLLLAWILVLMLIIFYIGGGIGNIPYTDIIGKIIPPQRRGAFFGGKGALAGPLSVGAALAARQILSDVPYPNNYATLFGLAALSLGIASIGFWTIREPINTNGENKQQSWRAYWLELKTASRKMKSLIAAQLLTGFSLMSMPFYVVFARSQLNAPAHSIGLFLLAQVLGGVLSNLLWARLVDHSGSRKMLFICAVTSIFTPILAITLGTFGWMAMLPVFFLVGAITDGRKVGFQSALLEVAPTSRRSTYAGLNAILTLPIAFLSLAAGVLLQYWSFNALFFITALFIGAGSIVIYHWAKS
ncbi:MAG: MFS transporter [Chloroflexota bacterium]|nr:MFS transporter [Chloroflexota bacterium]